MRWRDVNLEQGRLQVRGTLQRTKESGLTVTEPKTKSSIRQVILGQGATSALRRRRAVQAQERLRSGNGWLDHDFVFTTEAGRPIEAGNLLRHSYWPLLDRAGLPRMRFHDLRHTAATLLLERGVHPKIVSEMLGHSQISITLDLYSHVSPTMQAQAAQEMDAALNLA